MERTVAVMFVLLAILFAGIGGAKIARAPFMRANAAHLGYSLQAYHAIGALEVAGAGGLNYRPVLAADRDRRRNRSGRVDGRCGAGDPPGRSRTERAGAGHVGGLIAALAALAAVFGVIGAVAG